MLDEPLDAVRAKQLAVSILSGGGSVRITDHARKELEKDDLDEADALNCIRRGFVDSIDYEQGTWRYRFAFQFFVRSQASDRRRS